jgi:DNA-binding beta-propeller fold protein YncE
MKSFSANVGIRILLFTVLFYSAYFGGCSLVWAQYLNIPPQSTGFTYPTRGVAGDLWADKILGQIDFSDITTNQATNGRVFAVGGVVVDTVSSPQRLYVYDSDNSRILGFSNISQFTPNAASSAPGFGADIVLGQPDFTHTGCNWDGNFQDYPTPTAPSASCLCGLPQVANSVAETGSISNMTVDSQGNLYVPDYWNNRVLRYNAPVTSTEPASYVWGQGAGLGSFSTAAGNLGPSNLNFTNYNPLNQVFGGGAGVDAWGNLWVADTGNNRVLRFPNPNAPNPGIPSGTADTVLGQADFNSNGNTTSYYPAANDWSHLQEPMAVRVDSAGNVYVADYPRVNSGTNSVIGRILVFEPTLVGGLPTYTNGMAASGATTQYMVAPQGLEWDAPVAAGGTGGLWVADYNTNQAVLFGVSPSSPANFTALKVLLQDLPTSTSNGGSGASCDGAAPVFNYQYPAGSQYPACHGPVGPRGGLGVDGSGNVYLTLGALDDVWQFPAPIPTPQAGTAHSADVAVFKPAELQMANLITPSNFPLGVKGVAVAQVVSTPQIIVSDGVRLLYWNTDNPSSLTNGQTADGVAGVPSAQVSFGSSTFFGRIYSDDSQQTQATPHLWVIRGNGSCWVEVYNLPLTPNAAAAMSITSPLPVLGGGSVSWTNTLGLAVDSQLNLWLSDTAENRVLHVRNPLTNPMVDIILGQTSASAGATLYNQGMNSPNPTAYTLGDPGFVTLDHHGNLYVSDFGSETTGNGRLLRFDASTIQNNSTTTPRFGIPASAVFGRNGNFNTGSYPNIPSNPHSSNPNLSANYPLGVAFSPDDSVMVMGKSGYAGPFPVVFTNPTLPQSVLTATGQDWPVTYLQDYGSDPFSATSDSQGNFYLTDWERSRLLIYYQPFATPFPTLTPSPTPVTSAVWRVNCGGGTVTDSQGNVWAADEDFVGGSPETTTASIAASCEGSPLVPAANQPLYQTNRAFPVTYTFPVPSGEYQVTLKFAETYWNSYASEREFNVAINGAPELTNFNIMAAADAAGGCPVSTTAEYVAVDEVFNNITVNSGQITIGLSLGSVDQPLISAIQIVPQETATPTPTGTLPAPTPTSTPEACAAQATWTVEEPWGLALDPGGNVYAAENSNEAVSVFTSGGAPLAQVGLGALTQPVGVAVDGNGNIYVTDEIQNQVDVFNGITNPTNPGALAVSWGSLGTGTGQFTTPSGIAVNSAGTSVYVADTENQRIEAFTGQGAFLTQWGGPGTGSDGTFDTPTGVALDASGNVYVADVGTGLVQVFTSGGGILTQWDVTQGTSLLAANFIAVYGNCLAYVTDGFGSAGVFDLNGDFLGYGQGGTTGFWDTEGVAAGKNGDWYVADDGDDQVFSFGNCLEPYCFFTPPPTPTPQPSSTATWTPTATFTPTPTITSNPTATPTMIPSFTPTLSPTFTVTSTVTSTPTESCHDPVYYPNPVIGEDAVFCHLSPCDLEPGTGLKMFTVAFRKVVDKDISQLSPGPDVKLVLTDESGRPLANGLYYVVVTTPEGRRSIGKLIILR